MSKSEATAAFQNFVFVLSFSKEWILTCDWFYNAISNNL